VQQTLQHYNDSAVAALERHDWTQYRYYNKVYTQLFKEMSADATLADYCRTMQQSRQNKRIAVIVLLVLLVVAFAAFMIVVRIRRERRRKAKAAARRRRKMQQERIARQRAAERDRT
jgi:flagellar biosynthesis/type III secretory pathway M-ring protein FliF/YscJ